MALASLALAADSAMAAPNDTVLVSRGSGSAGAQGDSGSLFASISRDGRHVAFDSVASNLSPDDPASDSDVYVRDLVANTTTLVSRATGAAGATGNGGSRFPSISTDGRFVAFQSEASLSPDDTDAATDVYVRDLVANTTTLVSRAVGADGAKGNFRSGSASISGDGRLVAFESFATNLSPVDSDEHTDVYVRDLAANTTTLVSRAAGADGAKSNDRSNMPAISEDGRHVAFESAAWNLIPGGPVRGRDVDVYVRDLVAHTTTLVSRATGAAGARGNDDSSFSQVSGILPLRAISADGRYVAFNSYATNLSPDDTDFRPFGVDVYVRDLVANTTTFVSRASGATGADSDHLALDPSISGDGRYVAFESYASNLTPDDTGAGDVFVRDLSTDTTMLVSRATGAAGVRGNNSSFDAVVSADGRFVAFDSWSSNLIPDDNNDRLDVFVRELGPAGSPPPPPGTPPPGTPPPSGTPPPATPPGVMPPAASLAPAMPIFGAPLAPGAPALGPPLAPSAMPRLRASLAEAGTVLRRLRIRGLLSKGWSRFEFAAPAAGTLRARATAQLAGRAATSSRSVAVLVGNRTFARAEKRTIKLTLTSQGRRALRRASRVTLRLKLVFVDAAGRTYSQARTVSLRR